MTATMTHDHDQGQSLRVSDLPSLTAPPEGVVIPRHVRRSRARVARREFLRLSGAAVVGTGLAFAGLFPTARPAHAGHARPCWKQAQYCTNPTGSHPQCGSSGRSISRTHCANSGWHRHNNVADSPGWYYEYRLRQTSCNGRNAWLWNAWRCSDGRRRRCSINYGCPSSWTLTVCPYQSSYCPANP